MKSDKRDGHRYFIEAAARTLDILESFTDNAERLSITEIARRARQPYTSAFRFLYTLEQRGYVMRVPGKRQYVLSPARKKIRIGYAALGKITFAAEVTRSIQVAARRFGIALFAADNEDRPSKALANAEQLLSERIDLLIEFQRNDAVSHLIATKCRDAGIPAIAINFPQPGAYYFGADSFKTGLLAGSYLRQFAQQHWRNEKLMCLVIPSKGLGSTQSTREAGLREALDLETGTRVECEKLSAAVTSQEGYKIALRFLRKLNRRKMRLLIAAFSDSLAIGAERALRESGWQESAVIVGQGGTAEGRRHILRGGPLQASIAYFPESYGQRVIKLALRILEGQHPPLATYTDHLVLTKSNISEFYGSTDEFGDSQISLQA